MPNVEQGLQRLDYLGQEQQGRLRLLVEDASYSGLILPPELDPNEKIAQTVLQAQQWGYDPTEEHFDADDLDGIYRCAVLYLDALAAVVGGDRTSREFFLWSMGEPDFFDALKSMQHFSDREHGSQRHQRVEESIVPEGSDPLEGDNLIIRAIREHGYLAALFSPQIQRSIRERAQDQDFVIRLNEAVATSARQSPRLNPLTPLQATTVPEALRDSWLADCLWLMETEDAIRRAEQLHPQVQISEANFSNVVGSSARGNALYRSPSPKIHWVVSGGDQPEGHEWQWGE